MKSATRRQCLLVHLCILALLGTSTGPSFAQQLPLGDAMSVLQGLIGGQLPPRMRQPATRSQQPAAGAGPSFDCNRAKAAAEITICTHSDLAALDRTMAESYAEASAANPGQAGMLAAQQRRFWSRRDACGNSPPCLRHAILSQIAVLNQGTPQPMLEGTNDGPAALPVPAAPMTAAPVSSGRAEEQCTGQGPSFDCSKVHSAVEIAICRSPTLACLDAQLATTYKDAFTRFAYALKDAEKYKQLAWLSERGRCEGNEGCLEKMYRQRLAELSAFAGPLSRDSSGPQNNSRDGASNGLNMSDRRRLTEERQKNLSQCRGLTTFAKFRDCECLADAFMAERIKQGWSVGENAIRDRIQGLCVNRASIKKDSYNKCMYLHVKTFDLRDARLTCLCAADHFSDDYSRHPNDSSEYQISKSVETFFACIKEVETGAYVKPRDFDSLVADLAAPYPKVNEFLKADSGKGNSQHAADKLDASWLRLQMLARNPAFVSDEILARQLSYVVGHEQDRRKKIDDFMSKSSSIQNFGLDPLHPSFVFDWQSEVARHPSFANGALIDLFLNREQDWSFLKSEKDFDTRYNHVVEVFIFSPDSVMGRQSEFAARELVPVFRQFLSALAERILPTAVIEVDLPNAKYDFATGILNFGNDQHSTLLKESRLKASNPATQDLAIYAGLDHSDSNWPWNTPSIMTGEGMASAPSYWADAIKSEADLNLGLDRHLTFNKLRMAPADAEATLMSDPGGDGYKARIMIRARDAVLAPNSKKPFGVVIADLVGVEIVRKDGVTLAKLKPDDFPLERDFQDVKAQAEAKRQAAAAVEKEALAKKAEEEKINSERQKRIATVEDEKNIAHKQERSAGAFGRDIVKVQLGMTIEQADATIRQQMKVAAVVELKPGTWGYTPTLLWRRIYASSNGTDLIALYALPQAENRVVGVSRRVALPLPGLTKEEASKLLTDKYGAPSATYDRGYGDDLYWTDNPESLGRACKEIGVDNQTHGYVYTEGKLDEMRSRWVNSRDAENHVMPDGIGMAGGAMLGALLSNDANKSRDVRSCPTTLVAMLSPDAQDPALRLTLVDGGWVAGLIEAEQQAKSGGNVEAVKSLLDGAN